ncbi:hypothetical protein KJ966_22295 [bacterium]|nr:hypothetical protein [bacterium]
MIFKRIRILFFLLLCFYAPCIVFAKEIAVEYQSYQYDKESGFHNYISPRVTIDATTITGGEMSYHKDSNIMEFKGNIIVYSDSFIITAEKAFIDIKESKHSFINSTFYDQKNKASGSAEKIEQISGTKYVIHDGIVSTCDPEEKAVRIKSSRIVYNIDDFAYSLSTSVRFYSIPIFYTPFLSWPTKQGRATGLLSPEFLNHTSSDETKWYGSRLLLPYFIALDKDHDLTVTADLIQKRGLGLGLDYQYAFLPGLRGGFYAWYLDETADDRDFELENMGSLSSESDNLDKRPQRYKYSFNHRQGIFLNGTLTLNLLENSDNEVNKEYFNSNVDYDYYFYRILDLSFPFFSGSLSASYSAASKFTYTSVYDDSTDEDYYLNRQPSISISQRFSNIFQTPLSISLSANSTNYTRKYGWNGLLTTGSISTSFPFYLDFLNVKPSYSRIYYDYNISYQYKSDEIADADIDNYPGQFGWYVDSRQVEFDFEAFRYFFNNQNEKSARLSFTPRLTFKETDDVLQPMPSGDFGIGSTVMSQKNMTYQLDTVYKIKDANTKSIRNLFSLSLIQPFDLNSENCAEEGESASFCVDHHPTHPEVDIGEKQLPLRMNLSVNPTSTFSGSLFYRYHHQQNKIVETRITLSTSYSSGSSFSAQYINNLNQYYDLANINNPAATSYKITSTLLLNNNLNLDLQGTWDLSRNTLATKYSEDETVERLDRQLTSLYVILSYKHRCFSYSIQYSENIKSTTENDHTKEYLSQKLKFTLTIPLIPSDQSASLSEIPYQQEFDI